MDSIPIFRERKRKRKSSVLLYTMDPHNSKPKSCHLKNNNWASLSLLLFPHHQKSQPAAQQQRRGREGRPKKTRSDTPSLFLLSLSLPPTGQGNGDARTVVSPHFFGAVQAGSSNRHVMRERKERVFVRETTEGPLSFSILPLFRMTAVMNIPPPLNK